MHELDLSNLIAAAALLLLLALATAVISEIVEWWNERGDGK